MTPVGPIAVSAVLAAGGYYFFAWTVAGHGSTKRSIVPQYDPPPGLSPAMVRFAWKECFDDRTFWASVLSLVSKKLATIETEGEMPVLRPMDNAQHPPALPEEERLLLKRVLAGSKRKGMPVSMLDEKTAAVASEMANVLQRSAVGTIFFKVNNYLIAGIAFSVMALCLVARPSRADEWMALIVGLGVMAPGAFYLLFLVLRICDILVAEREKLERAVIVRGVVLLGLVVPCVAAITLGAVVLTTTFGWPTVAAEIFLTGVTLLFTRRVKARTTVGLERLDQIEGFRLFLQSVEHLPMDREDGPSNRAGAYEKYLPYAVALEVDQKWSDKLVAMSSTSHGNVALTTAHSFYLGMWNGKPVEMVFAPRPPGSRGF